MEKRTRLTRRVVWCVCVDTSMRSVIYRIVNDYVGEKSLGGRRYSYSVVDNVPRGCDL